MNQPWTVNSTWNLVTDQVPQSCSSLVTDQAWERKRQWYEDNCFVPFFQSPRASLLGTSERFEVSQGCDNDGPPRLARPTGRRSFTGETWLPARQAKCRFKIIEVAYIAANHF